MKENPFDLYPEEYEQWFRDNEVIFQREVKAVEKVLPSGKKGVEIGIGSGIFAIELGIKYGIDPSAEMLKLAEKRGIIAEQGIAEELPYDDKSFDFALFSTSICFIDDISKAFREAHRILREKGSIIITFVDRESKIGQYYLEIKEKDKFYRTAEFYSVPEVIDLVESNGFKTVEIVQTLISDKPDEGVEEPRDGYGEGSFIVLKGEKI